MASAIAIAKPSAAERATRHSALTRRIVLVNAGVLLFLIAGVLAVQSSRVGLIDERLTGIEGQARIVSGTLAEYATNPEQQAINVNQAEPLLRELIAPTDLRARLYAPDGSLVVDTRDLLARNVVQTAELPPIDSWSRTKEFFQRLYDGVLGIRPFTKLAPYFEAGSDGRVYDEVNAALAGNSASAQRVDEQNKLVLSVATPVQRFKAIYGVLLVSTESGDIDAVLREERATLLEVAAVAIIVMLASSILLSRFIARPVLALADAADRVRSGRAGRDTIPRMEGRSDEIGDLAQSFSAMTRALYDRIDAIEQFAADVAHELKNPLTSLGSGVEMMARAKDDATRERLLPLVRNDVKRIDRLITDISDASRLDAELSRETRGRVNLNRLLETIAEIYQMVEMAKGVVVTLTLDLPKDTMVAGRDERLGQVVRNLIDNAISFSADGATVAVSASLKHNVARIVVEDSGPGIPPDNLETIFQRFYTERPHEHGFGKNSGLGLSIARQIVVSSGGRIWAENREEGGARFIVELPGSKA